MENEACKSLIESAFKTHKHRQWIKGEIKTRQKQQPLDDQHRRKLCLMYSVLIHIPFDYPNEIYAKCAVCTYGDLFTRGKDEKGNHVDMARD